MASLVYRFKRPDSKIVYTLHIGVMWMELVFATVSDALQLAENSTLEYVGEDGERILPKSKEKAHGRKNKSS